MENTEIKALIDKYKLVRRGDKIGTYQTKGIDKDAFLREVGEHKAEINAYFDAQELAEKELREKRAETFDRIHGVKEVRTARAQCAKWRREFNRMMETGSSKMPYVEAPTPDELAALEAQYPIAVFALEAQYRARTTENYELSAIWTETYNALCDGADPESVKAEHDAKMSAFTKRHLWD